MPSALLTRIASLLLLTVMLLAGVSAHAGIGSPYTRAVRKGRVFEHRPNYRQYKPAKLRHNGSLFRHLKHTLRDK